MLEVIRRVTGNSNRKPIWWWSVEITNGPSVGLSEFSFLVFWWTRRVTDGGTDTLDRTLSHGDTILIDRMQKSTWINSGGRKKESQIGISIFHFYFR